MRERGMRGGGGYREQKLRCRASDEGGFNADRKGHHQSKGVHFRGDAIFGGEKDQSIWKEFRVGTYGIVQQIG